MNSTNSKSAAILRLEIGACQITSSERLARRTRQLTDHLTLFGHSLPALDARAIGFLGGLCITPCTLSRSVSLCLLLSARGAPNPALDTFTLTAPIQATHRKFPYPAWQRPDGGVFRQQRFHCLEPQTLGGDHQFPVGEQLACPQHRQRHLFSPLHGQLIAPGSGTNRF